MSTETALAVYDPDEHGQFLALTRGTDEIAEIVAENLSGQDVGEFDLRRIGMPAGGATVWEVPTLAGMQNTEELSGILVFTKQTRSYWSENQDTGERPLCSSNDARIGVGTPGGDCRSCPLAEFGSKPPKPGKSDSRAQACTHRTLWFLLRGDSFLPVVVSLSPASLKAAKQYMLDLSGVGLRFNEVITTIRLEADKNPDGDKFSRAIPRLGATLDPATSLKARSYAALLRPILEEVVEVMAREPEDISAAPSPRVEPPVAPPPPPVPAAAPRPATPDLADYEPPVPVEPGSLLDAEPPSVAS